MALCCSSNNPIIFGEVLSRVDMNDITVHNSLALFTSILVGKYFIKYLFEDRCEFNDKLYLIILNYWC